MLQVIYIYNQWNLYGISHTENIMGKSLVRNSDWMRWWILQRSSDGKSLCSRSSDSFPLNLDGTENDQCVCGPWACFDQTWHTSSCICSLNLWWIVVSILKKSWLIRAPLFQATPLSWSKLQQIIQVNISMPQLSFLEVSDIPSLTWRLAITGLSLAK